jgi:hypothetical protein
MFPAVYAVPKTFRRQSFSVFHFVISAPFWDRLWAHLHLVPTSRMRGALHPFRQYAFMARCSLKAQGQLYFTLLYVSTAVVYFISYCSLYHNPCAATDHHPFSYQPSLPLVSCLKTIMSYFVSSPRNFTFRAESGRLVSVASSFPTCVKHKPCKTYGLGGLGGGGARYLLEDGVVFKRAENLTQVFARC